MLWLDDRWWDEDALRAGVTPANTDAQTGAVFSFSRAWLRGDETFEVQTSGSTGAPKPIQLLRGQMEASARATGAALGLTAGMSALVCLPVHYIAGRMMLVRGFVLGLKLIVVAPAADPLATLPPDIAIDLAAFVPLQIQTLLDIALLAHYGSCFPDDTPRAASYRRRLDAPRAILVGGGPISPALETQIRHLTAPVYHTYGMTESATHVALRRLNGADASPAFVPLPGVATGIDTRGCLHLRGPMTNDVLLQTNDLVELQPDGSFLWLGRWDNVINSGGVKVQVESVEATIAAVAAEQPELGLVRRRFFVAGLPDARLGQVVTLVVEGDALNDDQAQQLGWALSQALPRHHAPRQLVYSPRFAETPTGKIDRKAVLAFTSS
ncbi:AMP-binding protein [Caldilinea sp.]|uniref:AMP-binding protein n=1 Tax=Caldilinea sp. TaxID=2293560 RepID=UPI002C202991|nr:AMP-binding protein [Anaerolineales bacterium]HQY92972.1 AMP-binding protein [Caldilinea sp.]